MLLGNSPLALGGTAPPTYGIRANAIGNGIVEQNIIDASADHPLHYFNQGP